MLPRRARSDEQRHAEEGCPTWKARESRSDEQERQRRAEQQRRSHPGDARRDERREHGGMPREVLGAILRDDQNVRCLEELRLRWRRIGEVTGGEHLRLEQIGELVVDRRFRSWRRVHEQRRAERRAS